MIFHPGHNGPKYLKITNNFNCPYKICTSLLSFIGRTMKLCAIQYVCVPHLCVLENDLSGCCILAKNRLKEPNIRRIYTFVCTSQHTWLMLIDEKLNICTKSVVCTDSNPSHIYCSYISSHTCTRIALCRSVARIWQHLYQSYNIFCSWNLCIIIVYE